MLATLLQARKDKGLKNQTIIAALPPFARTAVVRFAAEAMMGHALSFGSFVAPPRRISS